MERKEWTERVIRELDRLMRDKNVSSNQVQTATCRVVATKMTNDILESDYNDILDILLTEGYPVVNFQSAIDWIVDQTHPDNVEDPEGELVTLYLDTIIDELRISAS